jgi:hypothetical protein
MKKYIRTTNDTIMAMANINKKRTGLRVNIWSDGQGCLRNKPDKLPRVKLDIGDASISVSISDHPVVLAPKNWLSKFKQSEIDSFEEGIEYVARNYDLLLKHYMDTDGSFDDFDLFNALKSRGEFK